MSSSATYKEKGCKRKKKKKSTSSSDTDSSFSSIDEETARKLLKKLKKLKRKKKRKKKERNFEINSEDRKARAWKSSGKEKEGKVDEASVDDVQGATGERRGDAYAPMTREQWERDRNVLKRVYDEETGRTRLVKGNGEIMEECVSRERHRAINKHATMKDGEYFQKCLNPKYKGRVYIGFTIDPNRRIKQHNRGKQYGGAWKTSKRGPWEMVLTIHGFPSDVSALRFEWAWQHPRRSRRLKFLISQKKSCESSLEYNIRLMFTMLSIPPWNRLPLTIRWLSADVAVDVPPNLSPPAHMPVSFGPVISKKIRGNTKDKEMCSCGDVSDVLHCELCRGKGAETLFFHCPNSNCKGTWHIFCLADRFLEAEMGLPPPKSSECSQKKHLIPVEGSCPQCNSVILWGDLVRKKKGCTYDAYECSDESFLGG